MILELLSMTVDFKHIKFTNALSSRADTVINERYKCTKYSSPVFC